MKRLKAMSNKEWVQRYIPENMDKRLACGVKGCPHHLDLDNNCSQFEHCADCWDSPAKRNGKYIMKVVKEC